MPVPQVNSVSPNNGDVTGGEEVTVTGQHFTGATAVTFGVVAATSFSVVDDQHLTAVAPALPGLVIGVVDVKVTTTGGTSAAAGGDHFTYTSPTHSDILNAVETVDAEVDSNASQLSGLTANVDALVSSVATVQDTLTVLSNALRNITPTVTGISPNSFSDFGGTVVITGTGFTGAIGVSGTASFHVDSDTQITAVVPGAPTGYVGIGGDIQVVLPHFGGNSSYPIEFTYVSTPLPVVTGVSPTSGPVAGGTVITITGSGFGPVGPVPPNTYPIQVVFTEAGSGEVMAYVPATVINEGTLLVVQVPLAHTMPDEIDWVAGVVDLTVMNYAGTSAITAAGQFTFE